MASFFARLNPFRRSEPAAPADESAALISQLETRLQQLTESYTVADRLVMPWERFLDGNNFYFPAGYFNDRKAGRDWPTISTEVELRNARAFCRLIAETNPLVITFLDHVTNFVVKTGFKWQVSLRGQKKKVAFGTSPDPDIAECQKVLDEFRQLNGWGDDAGFTVGEFGDDDYSPRVDLEHEGWRRAMRDGELFLRIFRGGAETNGVPLIRVVEPECVTCPPGGDQQGDWSWGILTDPADRMRRKAYHVLDPDGTGADGESVPAGRVLHLALNVDGAIKRGLPDFWPLQDEVQHAQKLWRNMAEVSAILSAIAYIRQHAPGVTATQVQSMLQRSTDGIDPRRFPNPAGGYPGTDRTQLYTRSEPGQVIEISNGMQYQPGPGADKAGGFTQVLQAIFRIVGVRWGCPEYFSGDGSNANFASTLVAGGPFEVAVQRRQGHYKRFQGELAKRVLILAAEAGRLRRDQIAKCEIGITPPSVAIANKAEDTSRRMQLLQAAGLSKTTVLEEEGYDPEREAANRKAEAEQEAKENPQGGDGAGGLAGLLGGGGPDGGGDQPAPADQPQPEPDQGDDDAADTLSDDEFASIFESAGRYWWRGVLCERDADGDLTPVGRWLSEDEDAAPAKGKTRTPPRPGLVWKDSTKRWVVDPSAAKAPKKGKGKAAPAAPDDATGQPAAAEPKPKKVTKTAQKKMDAAQAVDTLKAAVADPSSVTAETLPTFQAALAKLTVPQLKELAKQLKAKVGGSKAELAERIVSGLQAKAGQPGGVESGTPAKALDMHSDDDIKAEHEKRFGKPKALADHSDDDLRAEFERRFGKQATPGKGAADASPPPPRVLEQGVHDALDGLFRKYHVTGLVPIPRLRDEIVKKYGQAAGGEMFDNMLLKMRQDRTYNVISLSDRSSQSPEDLSKGISDVGQLFYYVEKNPNAPARPEPAKAAPAPKKSAQAPKAEPEPQAAGGLPSVPESAIVTDPEKARDDTYNFDDPGFVAAGDKIASDPAFRQTLLDTYQDLTLFKENADGLVPLSRLHHDMAEKIPGLTLPQFHAAIWAIRKNGIIELRVLNEVGSVEDRSRELMQNGRMYHHLNIHPEDRHPDKLAPAKKAAPPPKKSDGETLAAAKPHTDRLGELVRGPGKGGAVSSQEVKQEVGRLFSQIQRQDLSVSQWGDLAERLTGERAASVAGAQYAIQQRILAAHGAT